LKNSQLLKKLRVDFDNISENGFDLSNVFDDIGYGNYFYLEERPIYDDLVKEL